MPLRMNLRDLSVPFITYCEQRDEAESEPTGWKTCRPARLHGFQRKRSSALCMTRLSLVNCCSEPTSPPVRMIASRSLGDISSMNFLTCVLTVDMLSHEMPRSSTTSAITRRCSPGLILAGGTGVAILSFDLATGAGFEMIAPGTFET